MNWIDGRDETPPLGTRVLAFSPEYGRLHPMRYRIMDAQFFGISTDATHWAKLLGPDGTEGPI